MRCIFGCAIILVRKIEHTLFEVVLLLRIIIGITTGIWLLLVLIGKGGFVHLILLVSLGISLVEILRVYRSQLTEKS